MIASRLATHVTARGSATSIAPPQAARGGTWRNLRRRACVLAAPAHAATVTRVEIGSPNTTAFLLSGLLVGGELLALQAEVVQAAAQPAGWP